MSARRMILVNLVIILVLIVAGFVGYYFYNQSVNYISTDDATVSGQQIVIAAPATGQLTNWKGDTGSQFNANDTVGDITVAGAKGATSIPVTIPTNGTVVQDAAVNNEIVAAGTPLAYAYDMKNLYITANIKETQLNDVKVGQDVDVYVDAFSGVTIKGTVQSIGLATANTFSLLPSQSTTADFTKVTQVVPVTIQLQGAEGMGLVPGMSATVRIHR